MNTTLKPRPLEVLTTPEAPLDLLVEELGGSTPQHSLWRSAVLHLTPGLLLGTFVTLASPTIERWGFDPLYALLFGIGFVSVPFELGYLAIYARRTTGSWSPMEATYYRTEFSFRTLLKWGSLPALWMLILVGASMAFLDERLADSVFGWLPSALTDMARVDQDASLSGGAATALLFSAFVFNGILGPVTEEMYFRGHLMPRVDRFGRLTPVLTAGLFAIYHFATPWRYPAIFLGFLPVAWLAWRKRSLYVSLTSHLIINNVFIVMMLAAFLSGSA